MRHRVAFAAFACLPALALAATARADESDDPKSAPASAPAAPAATARASVDHANPRLKLSFRSFGVTNLDGSAVSLKGGQVDLYPVSRRFFRMGIEAEAGSGDTTLSGSTANLWYGLGGVTAGFQYPARVTPFVEGRFAAGALGGSFSGTIANVGGQAISGTTSATTFLYVGGVDAGVEVYTVSRLYLSAAIGWAHPVYTGFDYAAMQQNPSGGMQVKQIAADTFTFKLGIGI